MTRHFNQHVQTIHGNVITNEVGTLADVLAVQKASAKVIHMTPAVEAELELAT